MSRFASPDSRDDQVIRITAADAASPHVDDLLKRQASLRGEQGITASRKRKWYYQNWFVFGLVGMLGAIAAWAILEPYYDDYLYLQGKIQQIELAARPTSRVQIDGINFIDLPGDVKFLGRVRMYREWIYLLSITKPAKAEDRDETFDPQGLHVGDEIGLYVDIPRGDVPLPIAAFADASPPSRGRSTGGLSDAIAKSTAVNLLFFPLVAALIGLGLGCADGLVCRLWRRALLGGLVGLLIGFIGGFVSGVLAHLLYAPLTELARNQAGEPGHLSTVGFLIQVSGRGLGWMVAGMTAGLGQGIALRSGRLLLYGFLGGAIGGLLGGLLFDPIDLLILPGDKISGHMSRLISLAVIGVGVGVMIGVVELLARDAWLHMTKGPLAGKEFLIFKDLIRVGASPRSDIYLFNDDAVADRHAVIRAAADHYEIESVDNSWPVFVNGRPVQRVRLRHGDEIMLGDTVFAFHRKRTD